MYHTYWFVRIVGLSQWPRPVLSLMCFALLSAFFLVMLASDSSDDSANRLSDIGTALFFAAINGYAIVAGAAVIERSQSAMNELRPVLDCDDATFQRLRASLATAPGTFASALIIGGLLLGMLHISILMENWNIWAIMVASPGALGITLGTLLTWLVITHLVAIFARNAHMVSRMGHRLVRVDLLQPSLLKPFGRIALLPTLGLLGTQVLYPLLSLGGSFNPFAVAPGFIVTLIALTYLLIKATWPLHRRLAAAKQSALQDIENDIALWRRQQGSDANDLSKLQPMLGYREYLQSLSEWPFSLSTLARWSLYLIIPPVTWICAALMENAIDRLVD